MIIISKFLFKLTDFCVIICFLTKLLNYFSQFLSVLFFDYMFFILFNLAVFFLTIHFKHFDFIEWFDLSSNSRNLFKRSSINIFLVDFSVYFLVDSIMCIHMCMSIYAIWCLRISSNKHNSMTLYH